MVLVFWTPTALDSACLLVSPIGHPEFKNIVAFVAAYMIGLCCLTCSLSNNLDPV